MFCSHLWLKIFKWNIKSIYFKIRNETKNFTNLFNIVLTVSASVIRQEKYRHKDWKGGIKTSLTVEGNLYIVVAQSLAVPTLCNPMDCRTPAFPALHHLPELAQSHVHWIDGTIRFILCCPLLFLPWIFPSLRVFSNGSSLCSGGQNIGASASASVLPMNIQDWFPLGLTCWISLLSKGLSRVFSRTTTQVCQFFGTQPSLWSNCHIRTWLLEKS